MILTKTLSKYFYKKYIVTLLYTFSVSTVFVFIVDTAEQLRRVSKTGNGDILLAIKLALLKLPEILFEIFPFIILFGSLITFYNSMIYIIIFNKSIIYEYKLFSSGFF